MMERCTAWAEGRYRGFAGRVFDGTALRPRRDLLMWGELDDIEQTHTDAAAAAAAAGSAAGRGGAGTGAS